MYNDAGFGLLIFESFDLLLQLFVNWWIEWHGRNVVPGLVLDLHCCFARFIVPMPVDKSSYLSDHLPTGQRLQTEFTKRTVSERWIL